LRRAKLVADRAGVDLSDWENEFLGSVETRLNTYGRAFGDPDKGAPGAPLSARQGVKLKEITAKAKGEAQPSARPRSAWRAGRRRLSAPPDVDDGAE
jgi:hypothetical protein